VDFATEMVLVVATGVRPSSGFHVAIANAALDAGTLRVGVVEITPGAGCGTATVLTQPAAAARLARHEGAVEFVDEVVAVRCE
jgi:PrcB C-terminal